MIRGVNDAELPSLIEYGRSVGAEVRFIEYMDVGGATRWSAERVFSRADMLRALEARYGSILPLPGRGAAPAERFRLTDGTVFGIVASTTAPFCRACDRSRLTADGLWFLCLYASRGIDLRAPLRQGAPPKTCAGSSPRPGAGATTGAPSGGWSYGSVLPCSPRRSSGGTPTWRCIPGGE